MPFSKSNGSKKSKNSLFSQIAFVISETAVKSVFVKTVGALKFWKLFVRDLG